MYWALSRLLNGCTLDCGTWNDCGVDDGTLDDVLQVRGARAFQSPGPLALLACTFSQLLRSRHRFARLWHYAFEQEPLLAQLRSPDWCAARPPPPPFFPPLPRHVPANRPHYLLNICNCSPGP